MNSPLSMTGANSAWPQINVNKDFNSSNSSSSSTSNISLPNCNFFDVVSLESLQCPISKQIIMEPRSLVPCGHTFELHSLTQWYKQNKRKICPVCLKDFSGMVENLTQKKIITILNEQLKKASQEDSIIDNLYKKLPEIPQKAKIKQAMDLYQSGQKALGYDIIVEVIMNTSNQVICDQISELLLKLTEVPENTPVMQASSTSNGTSRGISQLPLSENKVNDSHLNGRNGKRSLEDGYSSPSKRSKISSDVSESTSSDDNVEEEAVLAEIADVPSATPDHQNNPVNPLISAIRTKLSKNKTLKLINNSTANCKDGEGNTPLHLAAQHCYRISDISNKLIDCGAKVDEPNNNGDTPLHAAARNNRTTMISFLRNKCAKVSILNKDGLLPVDLASSQQSKQLLLKEWEYQT